MPSPIDDGFAMPAEWREHVRCWMAWPVRAETWGEHIDAAREATAEIANTIAQFEPVSMIAKPKNVAEVSLLTGQGVSQVSLQHDDCWIRDMGPTFVVSADNQVSGIDWQWNAWGHRYQDYERDEAVAAALLDQLKMRRYDGELVVEGGALHVDGEGTLITTESVLLNPNRNPNRTRQEVEEILIRNLGVKQVIWLAEGLQDDFGGGHVENLARFVRPGVVLALTSSDPADPNHRVLSENLARLKGTKDAAGRDLDVVEVEQPRPLFDAEGRRLALSYVNFYLPNGGAIIPAYEDGAADKRAFDTISRLFPKREVIQLPALELAYGGGGIHSICLPQPVGSAAIALPDDVRVVETPGS
jgi:agmatine deiminase